MLLLENSKSSNYFTTNYKCTENSKTENLIARDLISHPHNDPNKFGSLSKKIFINEDKFDHDEGDQIEKDREEFKPFHKKLTTKQYADIIKNFLKQNQLKEALNVLEIRMLKEDRVKPESYIYSLLIGACGRAGYTKKAFELFNNMKKRGLKVHPGAYTGLFNACANSPWKEDGLSRAIKLQQLIIDQNYYPNDSNYNAMIKAFGRLGDLPRAFSIVDEMITRNFKIKSDTMNFLLQACVSSETDGFRYALVVWRKMLQKNIQPNIYSFNLMLRSVRDCGLGNQDEANKIILNMIENSETIKLEDSNKFLLSDTQSITLSSNRKLQSDPNLENVKINEPLQRIFNPGIQSDKQVIVEELMENQNFDKSDQLLESNNSSQINQDLLDNSENEKIDGSLDKILNKQEIVENLLENQNLDKSDQLIDNNYKSLESNKSSQTCITDIKENRPNLLAKQPSLGNIIALNEVKKPEDRLLLLGGANGFLMEMQTYGIQPDIRTFTQLLNCIPPTKSAEKQLMATMKIMKIKPDVDFYNMLIKKRSMRFDHEGGKDVLQMIDEAGYRPNLITYGVLAIGCKNRDEAKRLLSLMEVEEYRINSEILGAMLQQACYRNDFGYVMYIMELCLKKEIQPNKKFMEHLLEFRRKCLKMLREKTHHVDLSQEGYFQSGFKLFNARYQTWKTQVKIDEVEEAHPWEQFRTTLNTTNSKDFKDPNAHFKPRRLSRFKVKTSTKVIG
ncbi:pentatricopeptide repeat-containing protein 1, mitochondrial [Chrysoperla carnea]|uniref:pentatricopeptide repeat-containing protein 1, mitochondrial n=1 Tax=Chrysoperla carnea TaxID=189513 RepID=UPI001D069B19|nr:pentatricopeptide repeat-containing protein 1, mitochondrial [Chrysoperla carnea]